MEFPGHRPTPADALHAGVQQHCASSTDRPTPAPAWVPIRSLLERHRAKILSHLVALNESDRYLRFGYAASDAQLARYSQAIDFARDEVFGIFDRRFW